MDYEFLTNSVEKSGIKKMDFYKLVGISAEGYRTMIKDKTMKVETLEKIAAVLNIPVNNFFSENSDLIHETGANYSTVNQKIAKLEAELAAAKQIIYDLSMENLKLKIK